MKSLVMIILMALAGTAFAGGIIRSGTLYASSDGTNIKVTWGSTDESGVVEFVVERRTKAGGDFIAVGQKSPTGSNSNYEFIDRSAFKTTSTIYVYRIKTVYQNSVDYSSEREASINTSVGKRTWGSIKAMFR